MNINLYCSFIYILDDGFEIHIDNEFVECIEGNCVKSFVDTIELAYEYGYEVDSNPQNRMGDDYIELKII